jgi:hypothetical protein
MIGECPRRLTRNQTLLRAWMRVTTPRDKRATVLQLASTSLAFCTSVVDVHIPWPPYGCHLPPFESLYPVGL